MHPGNGCGNFTIGMIFLTEVSPVLWATGIYWTAGASLHGQHPHQQQGSSQFPAGAGKALCSLGSGGVLF